MFAIAPTTIPNRNATTRAGTAEAPPAPAFRDVAGLLALSAATLHFERETEIIAQGDRVDFCIQILDGCARTVSLLEDGRRHVGEFLLAGDLLGCDPAPEQDFGVEAVTPVTLRRISHAAIDERVSRDPAFARQLRVCSASQNYAAMARCILLGRKTAAERVANFLLEMEERIGVSDGALDLPMSRTDIADYLGLTTETVCRVLTIFRREGVIAVQRTRIKLLDLARLEHTNCDYVQ